MNLDLATMSNTEISMIVAGIFLMVISLWQIRKTNMLKKAIISVSKMPVKLDFDGDMKFLMFLINSKIAYHIEFRIKPIVGQHRTGILKDDVIEKTATEISNDIMRMIGERYKNYLNNYLDGNEGVITFISELVFILVTNEVLAMNKTKLSGSAIQQVVSMTKDG